MKSLLAFICLFSMSANAESITETVKPKIDLLVIMDNSGSMSDNQERLAAQIPAFIEKVKNWDFRVAVTITDAWRGKYMHIAKLLRWQTGTPSSGVYVATNETPNIVSVLQTNLKQGDSGGGDERAFESMTDSLEFAANNDFRRPDAKLVVLVVSDEDDFSWNSSACLGCTQPLPYNDPNIFPVSKYADFLELQGKNTTFSAITHLVPMESCANPGYPVAGVRYQELAKMTGGSSYSICDDNAFIKFTEQEIIPITEYIVKFGQQPKPGSILVLLNGKEVPQDDVNGWSFNVDTLELYLRGTYAPHAGDSLIVKFEVAK